MSNKRQKKLAAIGRPRADETESMVVGNDLLASMVQPGAGGVYFLSIDEIIKRRGWATYNEMIHDDQVKATLAFKKTLVSGRTYDLKPASEDADAVKQAKFAQEIMCRLNMKEVWRNALTAFEFGYSVAEKVYTRDVWDEDGQQYVFIEKISHRDPRDIQLKMDQHGNFMGARQQSQGKYIDVTPDKLWLHTHDKRFGNLYGNSDLRAGYRSWFAKKFIIQFWNVFLERFGAPMTTMKYPQGASEELKLKLKGILSNLASKTEILIPEGVEIALIEATRGGNAGYAEALSYHNNSIARAILMVALLGVDGDSTRSSNGDSQSFLHLRILFKLADELSQELARGFMDQVIKPLLDINFEKPQYPTFIWQDYGQFEGMKVADEIRQLHTAGIIDMDQDDVNYVRSILGLPLRGEDDKPDEVIRPDHPLPPPGGGAAQPPAAPQGNDRAGKGGATGTPESVKNQPGK